MPTAFTAQAALETDTFGGNGFGQTGPPGRFSGRY